MCKIAKMDAFREIIRALDKGELERANKISKIVSQCMAKDKKNNTHSDFIELKNKKQELLFKDVLSKRVD